jgi:hypothetical protein
MNNVSVYVYFISMHVILIFYHIYKFIYLLVYYIVVLVRANMCFISLVENIKLYKVDNEIKNNQRE